MRRDQWVLFFSTVSWDYLWQRHHEWATRLATSGRRVVFVEPIGIRMPKWEDRARVTARLRNRRTAGRGGLRPVRDNLWILDPIVNPFQQVGAVHRRNVESLTRQVREAGEAVGGGEAWVWTYVPTPLAREVAASIQPKLLVYDCVDALTENPKGVFSFFAESEHALSLEADLVLTSSQKLFERQLAFEDQRGPNPRTYFVPHGVDYAAFAEGRGQEAMELAPIPHPRLLFFGGIDERVDLELLARLARAHFDWQVVLLGAIRTDVRALTALPNVHYLGQIAHTELPRYVRRCDVLLLPYRRIPFSEYMNPAKLFECLATGLPTVGTALPVLEEYQSVMRVAENHEQFERAVEEALAEGIDANCAAQRQAVARANTWEERWEFVEGLIERRLEIGQWTMQNARMP